jgi:hypothetical protein
VLANGKLQMLFNGIFDGWILDDGKKNTKNLFLTRILNLTNKYFKCKLRYIIH